MRALYRREAEAAGVRFLNRHYVAGVRTEHRAGSPRQVAALDVVEVTRGDPADQSGMLRQILTTHRVPQGAVVHESCIRCETVVNCLGAWSPIFSAKIGVPDVTEPVRRQITLVDVHSDALPPGMIVDASGLYFHPEGPHVLAGYSTPDEPPGFDFAYDGDAFFEGEIWPRLAHRASAFERCGHVRGWAGLYAVTPDRSGIAGRVGGFANLYEAHSFAGRGVMQSYGVVKNLAALITDGRFEDVDRAPLARDRFDDPQRWVTEELHI